MAVKVANRPPVGRPRRANLSARPGPFTERGAIGTQWFNGFLNDEEYRVDLQGLAGLKLLDRVWRSDGTTGAVKRAVTDPLLQAKWAITPGGDTAQDKEIAQFVQFNLFGGMIGTFREFLTHALLMYRDGHSVFSIQFVYNEDTGKIHLHKLSPRLSKTLYRWFVRPDGTLDHIQQFVWRPSEDGATGQFVFEDLPGDDLLVLTLGKEGANYLGTPLLRNAIGHFTIKQDLYRIDAIACERNGLGVPVFSEPENVKREHRDDAADSLAELHAHERAYILEPFGWHFRLEGVSGSVRDILPSIQHHDLEIAKTAMATFLNLDQTGSYAKDWSETGLFLQNLHGVADIIAETVNLAVIRRLVDYNYVTDSYPTIACQRLDRREIGDYLRGVAPMVVSGAITMDVETENAFRTQLDLPQRSTAAEPAAIDTESAGPAATGPDEATQPGGVPAAHTGDPATLTRAERRLLRTLLAKFPEPPSLDAPLDLPAVGSAVRPAAPSERAPKQPARRGKTQTPAKRTTRVLDSYTWKLGAGGVSGQHCPECEELADGGPYAPDDLPAHPRDGATFCGDDCTCSLVKNYREE